MTTSRLAPLILLPGLLCDATLWRAQVDGLSDIAATFVADLTLDETVAAMASRVLAVAPDRFALGGLSMGGYVAFEIARQAPERVERLALFSTSAAPDSAERRVQRERGIASLAFGRFLGVTQRMLPQLIHPSRIAEPLGDTVRAMAERVGRDAFLRQQRAILSRPDSRPVLPEINVPTMIVVGKDDVLTPVPEAEIIHSGIARSTIHLLEKCGHLPALEQPQKTTLLLREWLAA